PLPFCHCPAMSSIAFFRLAAANTRTCLPCAAAGSTPAIHAIPAATIRASQERLAVIAAPVALFFQAYERKGFSTGSIAAAIQITVEIGGCENRFLVSMRSE